MSRNLLLVAVAAWVALMCIVWALFVPKGLSVGSFTLLTLTGPLMLVAVSLWRSARQPAQSVGQMWLDTPAEATDAHGRR